MCIRDRKEEGYEVVLVNSNPATIMTDTTIADKVYMEPLTLEYVAKILRYERPDAIEMCIRDRFPGRCSEHKWRFCSVHSGFPRFHSGMCRCHRGLPHVRVHPGM